MKKILSVLALFFALTAFTTFNGSWKNDAPHSQLMFTVTHMGINDVTGSFDNFNVSVQSSQPDFSDAIFDLSAQTESINTRVGARDNHLKSADFFDAEKHPALSFKSNKIKKSGKNKYKLSGNLTMHGITKPVTMDLVYKGKTVNAMNKKETIAFQVTGTIKRSDFEIGAKFPEAVISDVVRIKADGEFVQ